MTGIADPTIRHVKRSTFLVADGSEYDGETGYWVGDHAKDEFGPWVRRVDTPDERCSTGDTIKPRERLEY